LKPIVRLGRSAHPSLTLMSIHTTNRSYFHAFLILNYCLIRELTIYQCDGCADGGKIGEHRSHKFGYFIPSRNRPPPRDANNIGGQQNPEAMRWINVVPSIAIRHRAESEHSWKEEGKEYLDISDCYNWSYQLGTGSTVD
jgi:hypothetical protein